MKETRGRGGREGARAGSCRTGGFKFVAGEGGAECGKTRPLGRSVGMATRLVQERASVCTKGGKWMAARGEGDECGWPHRGWLTTELQRRGRKDGPR